MARRRGLDPFDKASMFKSAGLHVALIGGAWVSTLFVDPPPEVFLTYDIEIVSPPASQVAEEAVTPTEELVVERPDPEPEPPEPETEDVVPIEDPEPEPEPDPPPEEPVEEQPPEAAEETVVAATDERVEEEATSETGENIEVRMEGLQRDYPEYYNNIIIQIQRCFRWTGGGNWRASIFFYITRDGSVEGMDFVQRSGNTAFDFESMGAVDCAGQNNRLGALPDDFPYDRFPIRFLFEPRGDVQLLLPSFGTPGEVIFDR